MITYVVLLCYLMGGSITAHWAKPTTTRLPSGKKENDVQLKAKQKWQLGLPFGPSDWTRRHKPNTPPSALPVTHLELPIRRHWQAARSVGPPSWGACHYV